MAVPTSAKPAADAKPTEYHVTAASFHYDDAKRTATYDGRRSSSMKSTDGNTEGKSIDADARRRRPHAREARTPRAMVCVADVRAATRPVGDMLDYDAPTDIYMLDGKPARVKSPPQQKDGHELCP